jgi:hypothetical protein
MNIFCFSLLFEQTAGSRTATPEGSIASNPLENSLSRKLVVTAGNQSNKNPESGVSMVEEDEIDAQREGSHSGTGSSSSMKDSTASMAEFRNFHSFTEQATPKTLILIVRLIVSLYLIMLTVASVNLGINVER